MLLLGQFSLEELSLYFQAILDYLWQVLFSSVIHGIALLSLLFVVFIVLRKDLIKIFRFSIIIFIVVVNLGTPLINTLIPVLELFKIFLFQLNSPTYKYYYVSVLISYF